MMFIRLFAHHASPVTIRQATPTVSPFTLCEVKVFGQLNENPSGWTVIASQPTALLNNVRDWYKRPGMRDAGVYRL